MTKFEKLNNEITALQNKITEIELENTDIRMSNKQLQARALTEHDAEIMKNILKLIETNYENKMQNETKVKEIEVKIKEKEGQKEEIEGQKEGISILNPQHTQINHFSSLENRIVSINSRLDEISEELKDLNRNTTFGEEFKNNRKKILIEEEKNLVLEIRNTAVELALVRKILNQIHRKKARSNLTKRFSSWKKATILTPISEKI